MNRDEYQRKNQERDANRKKVIAWTRFWEWRPTWWKIPAERFSFFVAAFTGVLAVVGGYQLSALRQQITEMHLQTTTTRAQIRASIAAVRMEIAPYETADGKLAGWEITPRWKNNGATDAINLLQWWGVGFIDVPVPALARIKCGPTPPTVRY
jgi:hypothetical protein